MIRLAALLLVLGGPLPVSQPVPAAAVDCAALQPSSVPTVNRQSINDCLAGGSHRAVLTAGTYPVDGGIVVPGGAQLAGGTPYPVIRLVVNPGGTSRLVRFTGSDASVSRVRLDAGNLLALGCCSAVVMFEGNGTGGNLLEDATVTGAPETTGVYVLCSACQGIRVYRVDISGNFYGVIFGPFNDAAHPNTVLSSQVHDNRCDGVTFMGTDESIGRPGGYGVIDGSSLYRNGRDCENGIPGAAVYSAGNRAGARIVNSRLYENCGNNLDLVDVERCAGAAAAPVW